MKIRLDKSKLTSFENGFKILKENPEAKSGRDIIKNTLEESFPELTFDVYIVPDEANGPDRNYFVMSVFPEMSVIDKIVSATMANKETSAIQKLWETNKKWTIEIDKKILDEEKINFTEKELTAMLLHEVGHIVCSTSIPNRISLILRYELMNTKFSNKSLLKMKIFRQILALPILDACIADGKKDKDTVREEVKADAFAAKYGYRKELIDALSKLSKYPNAGMGDKINTKMIKDARFAFKTIDEFKQRKDKLMRSNLIQLRESCVSPYICNVITECENVLFEENENSKSLKASVDFMHERADDTVNEEVMLEFFLFKKELKKIDGAEIDYIYSKIQTMESEYDRMIVMSYIHSKLDLVDYYISLLENPSLAKKYGIPHTLPQLRAIKQKLLDYRKLALRFKIPEKDLSTILVSYPTGYEG